MSERRAGYRTAPRQIKTPTQLLPSTPADPSMTTWRQQELEALWFARVEEGLRILKAQPFLTWLDIADRYRCGPSTLRYWRARYWRSQAHIGDSKQPEPGQ